MTNAPQALPASPGAPAPAPDRRPRWWVETLFLLVALACMLLTATVRQGHAEFPGTLLLAFTLLAWAPLVLRTRWTLAALAGVVTVEALHLIVVPAIDPGQTLTGPLAMGAYQPVPLATMIAVWTVAARRPRRLGWAAGIGAGLLLFGVGVVAQPLDLLVTDLVMFQVVVIATTAGAQVTARRERIERTRRDKDDAIRRHVTDERLRIARDLHDTLAHHLTVVNAQAGVANYLLRANPDAAAKALTGITEHTLRALDDLRATIGLLRYDTDGEPTDPAHELRPVPGIDRLTELQDAAEAAGVNVSVTVDGTPRTLPVSVNTAAYRIVQEALTNAAKHAPGTTADITLTWSAAQLDVRVRNGPPKDALPADPAPGTGHGLIGMRERAHACGGTVITRHLSDGGYLVHATLPAPANPASTSFETVPS